MIVGTRRAPIGPSICTGCPKEISQEGCRRPRLYCSALCRGRAQEARRAAGIPPRAYRRWQHRPTNVGRPAYFEAYTAAHLPTIRSQQRAAYARLPERRARIRNAADTWRTAHPDETKTHRKIDEARRRARKHEAGVWRVTPRDIARLVARFDSRCAYCRVAKWEHIDHVIPISRHGRHSIGNLLPACHSCNQSKTSKTLVEWRYKK